MTTVPLNQRLHFSCAAAFELANKWLCHSTEFLSAIGHGAKATGKVVARGHRRLNSGLHGDSTNAATKVVHHSVAIDLSNHIDILL